MHSNSTNSAFIKSPRKSQRLWVMSWYLEILAFGTSVLACRLWLCKNIKEGGWGRERNFFLFFTMATRPWHIPNNMGCLKMSITSLWGALLCSGKLQAVVWGSVPFHCWQMAFGCLDINVTRSRWRWDQKTFHVLSDLLVPAAHICPLWTAGL